MNSIRHAFEILNVNISQTYLQAQCNYLVCNAIRYWQNIQKKEGIYCLHLHERNKKKHQMWVLTR